MEENSNITKALNILNYRDWTWEMADDNYRGRFNAAKAEMKEFVSLVNGIEDTEVRGALRRLWMLKYNELQAAYMNKRFEDKAELLSLEQRFASAA